MLSDRANEIIEDINLAHKKKNVEPLLIKYTDKSDQDFIQKYVETEIAIASGELGFWGVVIALIAILLSLFVTNVFNLNPEYVPSHPTRYLIGSIVYILLILALWLGSPFFIKSVLQPYKDILIVIADYNLIHKESSTSDTDSNLQSANQ